MAYLEERVEFLEHKLEEKDIRLTALENLVGNYFSNENESLISLSEAYRRLTGKSNVTQSAKSQYMSNLVKNEDLHKVLVSGRPKFKADEIAELIEARTVTGRIV